MIDFGCQSCGRFFRVSDDKAGLKGKCPDCGASIVVPTIDSDIQFDEPSIDDGSVLSYELRKCYETLVLLKNRFGLISSKAVSEPNLFEATFATENGRTHSAIAAQSEPGGLIYCTTTIGNVRELGREQLISILKEFHSSGGLMYQVAVRDDDALVAIKHFQNPPKEIHEVAVVLRELAAFGDKIEHVFFGADVH